MIISRAHTINQIKSNQIKAHDVALAFKPQFKYTRAFRSNVIKAIARRALGETRTRHVTRNYALVKRNLAPSTFASFLREPFIDELFKRDKRERAAAEHDVVELANVKRVAFRRLKEVEIESRCARFLDRKKRFDFRIFPRVVLLFGQFRDSQSFGKSTLQEFRSSHSQKRS